MSIDTAEKSNDAPGTAWALGEIGLIPGVLADVGWRRLLYVAFFILSKLVDVTDNKS